MSEMVRIPRRAWTRAMAWIVVGSLAVLPGLGLSETCAAQPKPAQAQTKRSDAATRRYSAAAALHNREQFDLAAREWADFLKSFPDDSRSTHARYYLAICHLKNKQFAAALEVLDVVVQADPEFELLPSAYFHRGLAQYNLAREGQTEAFTQAGESFAALIEKFPKTKEVPAALFYWGESLYARGKRDEAALLYAELMNDHPKDSLWGNAAYALGVVQQELGQSDAAGATFDAYLERLPEGPEFNEVALRRGETWYAQGQFDKAEKLFAQVAAVKDFSLADLALLRQATCAFEQKRFKDAAALYAALPTRFPDSKHLGAAQLAGGKCAFLAGEYPKARTALEPILAADVELATEAAHWVASCWLKEGQPGKALGVIESQMARSPAGVYALQLGLDHADALYELPDRRSESVPAYAAIAEQHPDDPLAPQALYMAGYASLEIGQTEPALRYAAQFLEKFPQHALAVDVAVVAAESYLQRGQHDKAGQWYAALLRDHPQNADVAVWHVRHGLTMSLQKQHAQVLAMLEPIVEKLPAAPLQAEAWYLIGTSRLELQQPAEAARAFEASLRTDPKWRQADEVLLALSAAYRGLGQADAARAALTRLVKEFSASRVLDSAHFRIGELAASSGDTVTAEAEFRLVEGYGNSPLVPHAQYELAWIRLGQKDAQGAATLLDSLVGKPLDPSLMNRVRYTRGLAREQLGQHEMAIEDLRAFLDTQPTGAERSDARYTLARCQARLKQHAEAASGLKALLDEDPSYDGRDKVLYELAWAYQDQDQKQEAAATFARLTAEHPTSPLAGEASYYVAEHEYEGQHYDKAAEAYRQALAQAQSPELGEKAAYKLGWSHYRLEQFEESQKVFADLRTRFPRGELAASGAFMEAESMFERAMYAEALSAYEAVLPRLRDASTSGFAALAALHAAQSAGRLKDWEKSLKLAENAQQEHSDSEYLPEILYEHGWALHNLGRTDDALGIYEKVTEATDREAAAKARFMIGEVHFTKKNHQEAVRHFFKAAYEYGYPEWQANAHYEAGRCFEVLKKSEQARKSYLEVVNKFPESDKAALAKDRLAALGG